MSPWSKIKAFFAWLFPSKNAKPPAPVTPTPPATTVPKPDVALKKGDLGIDVSHHNGKLDWAKIAASGVKFVFIKATEGATFKDPRFLENVRGASAAGLRVGAYHYFRPGISADQQAKNFLDSYYDARGLVNLPPVFDWEQRGGTSAQLVEAKQWLETVFMSTGVLPMIYTGPYFFRDEIGSPEWAAKYHLWIAHLSLIHI